MNIQLMVITFDGGDARPEAFECTNGLTSEKSVKTHYGWSGLSILGKGKAVSPDMLCTWHIYITHSLPSVPVEIQFYHLYEQ